MRTFMFAVLFLLAHQLAMAQTGPAIRIENGSQDPKLVEAQEAALEGNKGKQEAALAAYLSRNPQDGFVRLWLARLLAEMNRTAEAYSHYRLFFASKEAIVTGIGSSLDVKYEAMTLGSKLGDKSAALQRAKEILEMSKPPTIEGLGQVRLLLSSPNEVIASAHLSMTSYSLLTGSAKDAVAQATAAVAMAPHMAPWKAVRAVALLRDHKHREARQALEALRSDKEVGAWAAKKLESVPTYAQLDEFEKRQRETEALRVEVTQLLDGAIKSGSSKSWQEAAQRVLLKGAQMEKDKGVFYGVVCYEALVERSSKQTAARLRLAFCLLALNEAEKSKGVLRGLAGSNPKLGPEVFAARAVLSARHGEGSLTEAVQSLAAGAPKVFPKEAPQIPTAFKTREEGEALAMVWLSVWYLGQNRPLLALLLRPLVMGASSPGSSAVFGLIGEQLGDRNIALVGYYGALGGVDESSPGRNWANEKIRKLSGG